MNDIETKVINVKLGVAEVSSMVDRAVAIHREVEKLNKELGELKAGLRDIAETGAFPKEGNTVEIRSSIEGGCAQVVYLKDTPRLVEGRDPLDLKAGLTASQFALLFEEKVVLNAPDAFEAAFRLLPRATQRQVSKYVAWRPNTPQVRLSK